MRSRWSVVVGLLVAAITFAGCRGHGLIGAGPGAIPGVLERPSLGPSGDLIYAAKRNVVYIFTYPAGKHVAQFVPPNSVNVRGLCSDASGNVFVAANGSGTRRGVVYEYAHGSTSPSGTLKLPPGFYVRGCATDEQSGDIAVALVRRNQGRVAFYSNPDANPYLPAIHGLIGISAMTYEDSIDIFAWTDGGLILIHWKVASGWVKTPIYLPRQLQHHGRYIQWAGNRLAVLARTHAAKARIKRIQIVDSEPRVRGTTEFKGLGHGAGNGFWVQGSNILLPMGVAKNKSSIGIYPYPAGGEPETVIKGYDADLLTVSVSSSRTHSRR